MLNLLTFDEMIAYGSEIYLPQNWINIGVAFQDLVNVMAAIQDKCHADTFINKIADIFSLQGVS